MNKEWALPLLVIFGVVGYSSANQIHITYSEDNFLKVQTFFDDIKKVERCTFEVGPRSQGLRPLYRCVEIYSYDEF